MGMGQYILNEQGEAVEEKDLMKWGQWLEDHVYDRRLAYQMTPGGAIVSTVFLGLDHNWGDGDPVLWETMIFGGRYNNYQRRYQSKDQALLGHYEAYQKALVAETFVGTINCFEERSRERIWICLMNLKSAMKKLKQLLKR